MTSATNGSISFVQMPSRRGAEEGCESYQVSEDVESPNTFFIVERWASMEAQLRHFRTPGFGRLMGDLGDILAGPPEVSINKVSSTLTLDEALAAAGVSGGAQP
jgi:quinol monooxygenase YgiN